MIEIPLTQGKVALIDDEDYELVSRYKWCTHKRWNTHYAITTNIRKPDGRYTSLYMHRLILGLSDPRTKADHINGDGLDNQRKNIRVATHAQNMANSRIRSVNTSGFKGVTRNGRGWSAQISVDGITRYIATFATPQEAALAYDKKAREVYGEFARLNYAAVERHKENAG